MGMTIDEAISWILTISEHEGEDIPIYDTDVEAVKTAISTMRKYQKIVKILNSASYTENETVYSYTYDEDTRVRHIREVIEDENVDN